jgi:hypothetical protein
MFVSSYSTYIQTNNSNKDAKQRVEKLDTKTQPLSTKINATLSQAIYKTPNIPVNYISQAQVNNNKKEIELQNRKLTDPNQEKKDNTKKLIDKFNIKNSLINAQVSYTANSKMFSLIKKPHVAFNQTPSIENSLPKKPKEVKDIRELNLRHKMVNTYIANDNYYKVTA